jgi:ribonucleases P/MRP protein subunit RPP40
LWTLEKRQNRADLIELFKIHRHESAIEIANMFQPAAETQTRGHTLKLQKNRCRLDLRKYFFSERVVDRWNALDQKTVESGT